MTIQTVSIQKSFGGQQGVYKHHSKNLNCEMSFSVYLPEKALSHPCPSLYYLSGLTCNHENVTTKGGFQQYANKHNLIVVCPDTSPRESDHPNEHDSYDFGSGAGFYINATQSPWSQNYLMYDYITQELPELIDRHFNTQADKKGITGHSMGGHGALTIGLRNSQLFSSISAFAPIVAPSQCPWGIKAFSHYLGEDKDAWKKYDAVELIQQGAHCANTILIDQGDADNFLEEQLKTHLFKAACLKNKQAVNIRMQSGYDHSYYFISSFMNDHIKHHAAILHQR
ncbi:S-formylglutathione hydrolase [Aliikangiella sp. IMCC44653]